LKLILLFITSFCKENCFCNLKKELPLVAFF
jgi:hypothetical protein